MTDDNKGKAENVFSGFGKKVDNFMEELDDAGERLRKEFQEKYEELKVSAEKLKEESKSKDRWKEVEESLTQAGEHLKKAFEAAFKKREEQQPK
jgi:5S rRNA maturation endonuclease (ribonuclease M5)